MAELSQVYDALRKANAAGDTASAKKLADYIRSVESQTSTKAETTETDTDSSWLRPLDLAINAIYKGVANVPDVLLNAPTTISNVYRAAKGQPLTQEPNLVRKGFEAVGGIRPEIQPETTGEKALDILTQGATGGAISGGGGVLPTLARSGVGALSAGTGALSAEAAKRLGVGPIGQELAGVAGGLGGAKVATSLGTFGARPANVPPERIEAYKQFASKGARQPSEVLLRGSESQQSVANPVYNKSVGLPPSKDFGPSQLQQATTLIGNTYDNLLSGRQVKFDKPFFDTFKELFNKQRDLSQTGVTFAETRPIIATLDRIANLPDSLKNRIASLKNIPPETTDTKVAQSAVALVEDALNSAAKGEWTMDAKNYNEVRSILGADAQRAKADTRRSGLLRKMQKAFDDAADRSMPDIKDELSDVRGKYENLMILKDAAVGKEPGYISPVDVAKEISSREQHRSLYPKQNELKKFAQEGLSMSATGGGEVPPISELSPLLNAPLKTVGAVLKRPYRATKARALTSESIPAKAARAIAEQEPEMKRAELTTTLPTSEIVKEEVIQEE